MTSIRMLMQIAAQYNLMVHQLDVKSTNLNAPIEWDLYMGQAKGFEIENKNSNERLVYKLKKSL